MLTQEYLQEILSYDKDTELFRWRKPPLRKSNLVGEIAGCMYANGYNYIQIDDLAYRCGRLAWLYVYGELPDDYMDHKNTRKGDDRIDNLRKANNSFNQANRGPPINNTSGVKGVRFDAGRNRWCATITVNGKCKNLGRYHTKEEAVYAYAVAAEKAWGEFARHSLNKDSA